MFDPEEAKRIQQEYEAKPWKRKNFATTMVLFALDEGVQAAIDKCESIKASLETVLEAVEYGAGGGERAAASTLLTSVHNALEALL